MVRRLRSGGLTGRAAVLGLVVCAIALALAYPLRSYLAQRADIARLEHQQQATEQHVAQLRQRQHDLADPAVTMALARQRLHFVLPGETAYVVLPPVDSPPVSPPRQPARVSDANSTWYSRLWHTVTAANASAR